MVGHAVSDFLHPEDLEIQRRMGQGLLRGEPVRGEARVRTKDGGYRWVSSLVRAVLDDHGTVVGRIAGWRDAQAEHEARQALQASQAEYRLVAENAADVVLRVDAQNRVVWVSPSSHRLTGWLPEELLGEVQVGIIHPDDVATAVQAVEDLRAGALSVTSQVRLRNRRGWYSTWNMTLRRASDDPRSSDVVAALTNVDAEVAAQAEALRQEQRRVAVLESMLDPHVLLQAVRDEAGAIVDFVYADANQAACQYNRMRYDQLVGTRLLDVLPAHEGTGLLDLYRRSVDTGQPLVLDDYEFPHEILAEPRRFDIRGVKVGDALSFTWRDVTERSDAASRLAASEEQFRLLAEHSSDVVVLVRGGLFEWLSPSLTRMLGWLPEQWQGHPLEDFTHPDDRELVTAGRAEVNSGATRATRVRLRDSQGTYHWTEIHASPIPTAEQGINGVVATLRTVDDVVAYEQELQRRATLDDLTGALKREEVLRRLSQMVHYRRQPGIESAVVFCDVDNFKQINDTKGHAAGDEVLRTTAQRIRGAIRDSDLLARMGGDEFLVLLDGIHDLAEAEHLAHQIRQAVTPPIDVGETVAAVTISAGVTLRQPDEDPDAIIARADAGMYEAKAAGRNRVIAVG